MPCCSPSKDVVPKARFGAASQIATSLFWDDGSRMTCRSFDAHLIPEIQNWDSATGSAAVIDFGPKGKWRRFEWNGMADFPPLLVQLKRLPLVGYVQNGPVRLNARANSMTTDI